MRQGAGRESAYSIHIASFRSLKPPLSPRLTKNYSDAGFGEGSAFWVAEYEGRVIACVGLQRHSATSAELRR